MATTTTTTVCGVRARPLAPPPVQVPPLPTTVGPLVPLQYVPPPGVPLVTPTHAGGARPRGLLVHETQETVYRILRYMHRLCDHAL